MSDNYPVDAELRRQAERIEALEQAHAELAAKVERLSMKSSNTASLLREHCKWHISLESPAPAPDPVCRCGHRKTAHSCGAVRVCCDCDCQQFVPTAEPEPAPLDPIEKTVECTNCGHPVWFIAGENEPHPCTDCGTVNSREQPDIFDEDDVAGIDNYLTDHPGTLDVLEGISRFLGKIDRPEDIDLWEFDCFIAAIRSYGRDGAR